MLLNIMTHSIMKLTISAVGILTLIINDTQHSESQYNKTQNSAILHIETQYDSPRITSLIILTFIIMTFSITSLSMTTFSIMIRSTMDFIATQNKEQFV